MEDLFSTNITVEAENVAYRVVFDNEKYKFHSEGENKNFPSFSFKREHDEWTDDDSLPPEIKTQAINALEKYLMKQH